MATITLAADTDYSALTVANDDTIDCAGFILTLDVAPTETGVQVTSPGTNGRVVFDGGWNLSTWDFFAGEGTTAGMIGTLPEGATIKSITGGPANNARGIFTNNGTVITANGGSGSTGPHAIFTNNGTVTTANGGNFSNVHAIITNNGTVTTSNGGSVTGTTGVGTNNGTVTTANGGSAVNARGVSTNNGTVTTANGGTILSAQGIFTNNGLCLRLTDDVGPGVGTWSGDTCFVEGPHIAGIIPDNIKTIYSLGTLSASATIAADATVTTLSEGTGGTARPVNPFTQQVIG